MVKFILLILIVLGSISGVWFVPSIRGQEILPSAEYEFPCETWGHYVEGAMCKIDPEKIPAFFATQLTKEQLEILRRPLPTVLYCIVTLKSRADARLSMNFRSRPHEGSFILAADGIPPLTILDRLEFMGRTLGSQYRWVKVKYRGQVGYVAEHGLSCNRRDE